MGSSPAPAGDVARAPSSSRGIPATGGPVPETAAANVNSGHIAFQWSIGDVVLGASVHGITARNKELVRELLFRAELVGPGAWPPFLRAPAYGLRPSSQATTARRSFRGE
jgi:hypothetical protein